MAQETLNSEGFPPGAADGIYGPGTARAVREFQLKHGLDEDGIIGPETWQALASTRSGYSLGGGTLTGTLHGATGGDDVREAQLALADAGFSPGAIDSVYGPMTERAVLEFQSARDLPETGVVDEATWEALREIPERTRAGDLDEQRRRVLAAAEASNARRQDDTQAKRARPAAYVPGFSADGTDGPDLIGVQDRVEFLASVLASKQLQTPLAIGLFGDWGSGKSFLMRRLQDRIATLGERSARADEQGRDSYFWSHTRQIDFNAWLYAGGDIWSSFAAHVFRGVAGADSSVAPNPQLAEYQDRLEGNVQELVDRREGAEKAEAAIASRIAEIDTELAAKRAALITEARALGPQAADTAQAIANTQEGLSSVRVFLRTSRALRPSDLIRIALSLVAAGGVAAAAVFGWRDFGVLATVLAVILAAIAVFNRTARYLADTTRLQLEIRQAEVQREDLEHGRERQALERRHADEAIAAHQALPLVRRYAVDQAARWTGREQLGLVTEIRRAFEELSRIISDPDVPIDRVIVYIDDLDRCQARVVVEVLETIKLLLSLPHFVVVVGVDSRWLFRSLAVHFSEELGETRNGSDESSGPTPQDYLEKIFQYSMVLRPIGGEGFSQLLDSLLVDEHAVTAEPRPRAPMSGEDPARDTRPVSDPGGRRGRSGPTKRRRNLPQQPPRRTGGRRRRPRSHAKRTCDSA
jgi:peptidoglycan hydrolase-like protein with peptidoglycan-binding domain